MNLETAPVWMWWLKGMGKLVGMGGGYGKVREKTEHKQ